jgi:hypothetical protein
MPLPEQIRELRPHATWDLFREGIKLMLPFIAGLGIKEWIPAHAVPLMWTAAILVAGIIAYSDRLPRRIRRVDNKNLSQESPEKLGKTHATTLIVHSAQWISVEHGTSRPVERFIRQQIKETVVDSVSFKLNNPNLGGELPGAKDTHKILKLSYSYGDSNPREITKDEYDWLVLPEPPVEIPRLPSPPVQFEPKSQLETVTRNAMREEFRTKISWAQKVALRLIYRKPGVDLGSLVREIEFYGFGQDAQDGIILPLLQRDRFVGGSRQSIVRHPDPLNHKVAEELLKEWEKDPF